MLTLRYTTDPQKAPGHETHFKVHDWPSEAPGHKAHFKVHDWPSEGTWTQGSL